MPVARGGAAVAMWCISYSRVRRTVDDREVVNNHFSSTQRNRAMRFRTSAVGSRYPLMILLRRLSSIPISRASSFWWIPDCQMWSLRFGYMSASTPKNGTALLHTSPFLGVVIRVVVTPNLWFCVIDNHSEQLAIHSPQGRLYGLPLCFMEMNDEQNAIARCREELEIGDGRNRRH